MTSVDEDVEEMEAQPGEPGMSAVLEEAGYGLFNRIAETQSNIVYEAFA